MKLDTFAWINLPQIHVNVFHLTSIMSLHYLVTWNAHRAHAVVELVEKESHHLNCGLQIRQIWIQLITACVKYCERMCTKHASLIWTNWNSGWERSGPSSSWITWSLRKHLPVRRRLSVREGRWWTFWVPSLTFVIVLWVFWLHTLTTWTVTDSSLSAVAGLRILCCFL